MKISQQDALDVTKFIDNIKNEIEDFKKKPIFDTDYKDCFIASFEIIDGQLETIKEDVLNEL
jgi:hypothetical protein